MSELTKEKLDSWFEPRKYTETDAAIDNRFLENNNKEIEEQEDYYDEAREDALSDTH